MARLPRFHSPTSTYHIMLRGNNGHPIFFSEGDRVRMCLLLQQCIERFDHSVEAFCFMSNHIHLALRVADTSISKIMHYLAFRYTRYVNRLYRRVGHLFQGRFKSILIDDEEYLKELIRYIHLNPVRAGMVSNPQHYPWSSHRAYMGLEDFTWLSKQRVLKRFHAEEKHALCLYEKYILRGIGIETDSNFKAGSAFGMVGDKNFIDEMLVTSHLKPKRKIELPDLLTSICKQYNLTKEELCAPGKHAKTSQARALLALLVRETENISLENLAKVLGRESSGLSKLASRLEIKSVQDVLVAKDIQEMREWILAQH